MKRKMISALLCATMVASMAAGCGSSGSDTSDNGGDKSDSGKKVYAIVTKSAGNPYNEKEAEGFQKIIEAEGGECIVKHPESATADAQVSVIQSLISQGVDSIAIAGNDENALQAALEEAMDAGIKVCGFDSKVNADSRMITSY